jgi:hypothetical protein
MTELPEDITLLKFVRQMDVAYNVLTHLPLGFTTMGWLIRWRREGREGREREP